MSALVLATALLGEGGSADRLPAWQSVVKVSAGVSTGVSRHWTLQHIVLFCKVPPEGWLRGLKVGRFEAKGLCNLEPLRP